MPIKPENRALYPANWRAISERIRFQRAGGRCECTGECGEEHAMTMDTPVYNERTGSTMRRTRVDTRCRARHSRPHPLTGSNVVLTTAHLDHNPLACADSNLLAMCQRCHLRYDHEHHAEQRSATKAKARTE